MAKFGGMTLTETGRWLLAKALAGLTLQFSRVTAGDGFLAEGQDIYDMSGMVSPVRDMTINSIDISGAGTATIRAVMNNQGLDMGFFIREIGLFALDPDDETEVLYAYCNAGEKTDYMPGQGGPDAVEYLFSLVAVIDQATNVTAIIDSGMVYVTTEELNSALDGIFDESAHVVEFWTRTTEEKKLRPVTIPQLFRQLFGQMGDEPVLIGYNPEMNEIFGMPISRFMLRADRLTGGTPEMEIADYDGRIEGGTPAMEIADYEDGTLTGGDPQTL
ncbi:hypothetical protein FACS1894204_04050 [Synergistales bacterium]|nr:hypothetical protein FACS1894204_04050 [Synergistales bacterium]